MERVKLSGHSRKAVIVSAAVRVGREQGLHAVTFDSVAATCAIKTTRHTVKHWFPRQNDLWLAAIKADETCVLREQAEKLGVNCDE